MDIEYDPLEEVEDDDVEGVLGYSKGCWRLMCSEHGLIEVAADGSAESHDEMIRRWPRHMQEHHHGDGTMSPEDRGMMIHPS